MAKEPFLINPAKRTKRKSAKSTRRNPKRKRSSSRKNPYGREVIVVGANPKRRRKATRKRKTSRRRKRRNPVSRAPKRRVTRRRTRRNPVRRTAKRRSYRRNPVRKRRMRRNMPMVGALNLKKPMTLLMPVGVGVGSLVITKMVPGMLNLTGNMRYAAQVAVAIVGGMVLQKPLGKQNAIIFTVVSLTNTVSEVLAERVGGVFDGLGAFVDEYAQPTMLSGGPDGLMADDFDSASDFSMGQEDNYDYNMGAFVTGDPSSPYG